MKIFEVANKFANFLGTCVNSFDEDGDCTIPQLGYRDTSHFAYHEENADEISHEEFGKNAGIIPPDLNKEISVNRYFLHDPDNDVYMIYDQDDDIHYFFSPLSLSEASGYIPSKKEKNDPRFKTALTVDVKPDSIKKNAKAFGSKVSRAGIPPLLRK